MPQDDGEKPAPQPGGPPDPARNVALASGVLGLLLTLAGVAEKFSSLNYWIVSNVLIYVGLPLILLFVLAGSLRLPKIRGLSCSLRAFNDAYVLPFAPALTLLAVAAAAVLISVKIDLLNVPATQYVDAFPQNIPAINRLINATKGELLIGTDFASYGGYSSPGAAREYLLAIEAAKARGAKVGLVVYTDDHLKSWLGEWFDTQAKINEKFADEDNWRTFANEFSDLEGDRPIATPGSVNKFFLKLNEKYLSTLRNSRTKNITIYRLDDPIAPFFWVRDRVEAIFSFPCEVQGVGLGEVAFRTTDPKIITALVGSYERARKRGTQVHPPTPGGNP